MECGRIGWDERSKMKGIRWNESNGIEEMGCDGMS